MSVERPLVRRRSAKGAKDAHRKEMIMTKYVLAYHGGDGEQQLQHLATRCCECPARTGGQPGTLVPRSGRCR